MRKRNIKKFLKKIIERRKDVYTLFFIWEECFQSDASDEFTDGVCEECTE